MQEHVKVETVEKQNGTTGNGVKDIPTPEVLLVPTYKTDYLPTFREKGIYTRAGGAGPQEAGVVEYDADSDDDSWLENINRGQDRLLVQKFELMIWKLELANAAANERTLSAAGAAVTERASAAAVAATDHMSKAEALMALEAACPARKLLREAVYSYWMQKRKRQGLPLLRSLQAPTSLSDNSPYNVFRPRERIHRPQTRRRRETNEDAMEKLKLIETNLMKSLQMTEWVIRREKRQRDLVYMEVDAQQLAMKQRHEPRSAQEALEAEYLQAAKGKPGKRPLGFEPRPRAVGMALPPSEERKAKKRKRNKENPSKDAISQLPPPPEELQDELMVEAHPEVARLSAALPTGALVLPTQLAADLTHRRGRPRIGRGGRLIFDRCISVTYEPFADAAAPRSGSSSPLAASTPRPEPLLGASDSGSAQAGAGSAATSGSKKGRERTPATAKRAAGRPPRQQSKPS